MTERIFINSWNSLAQHMPFWYVKLTTQYFNLQVDHDQHELIFRSSVNTYRNVTITKSKNVHLGNVTYINGPVYINQTANIVNKQTIINQYINNNNLGKKKNIYICRFKFRILTFRICFTDVKPPRIVDRRGWLAQPPLTEPEERKKPAKYVIISKLMFHNDFLRSWGFTHSSLLCCYVNVLIRFKCVALNQFFYTYIVIFFCLFVCYTMI